jgi:branched-chain amino acid transport system permease protein
VREDEIAAEAIGINTTRTKVQVFTIGAFFAGIAGALYASYFFVIKPDQFGFLKSIDILVIVVLGGLGSMSGTIIAAILLAILSTALQEFSDIRMILYSLMLVLIMIFRPGGIMGSKEVTDTVLGRLLTRKGAKR